MKRGPPQERVSVSSCGNTTSDHNEVLQALMKARQDNFCKLCVRGGNQHECYRGAFSEKAPVMKNLEIVGVHSTRSTRGMVP